MKTHYLKTVQPYFDAVASGIKPFELRKFDRNFFEGDLLVLMEYSDTKGTSGRRVIKKISYMLEGYKGLEDKYVILGLCEPTEAEIRSVADAEGIVTRTTSSTEGE